MKGILGIALLVALALPTRATAQDAPQPPGPPPEGRPGGSWAPGERGERRGMMQGNPFVDRWMLRLKADAPDQYKKLEALRQGDPEGFRREIRHHLRAEIGKKLERERPAVFAAIQSLSEEDREWVFSRLFVGDGPGQRGPGNDQPGMHGPFQRRGDEGDPESDRLTRLYRDARTDEERDRARTALRDSLSRSYVRKHEDRRRELEQMESKLREAQAYLLERDKNREAIIEKRMEDLLAHPPAPPAPGGPP